MALKDTWIDKVEGKFIYPNDVNQIAHAVIDIEENGGGGGGGGTGADGKSAYEIAVENGFEGTEAEWLESLKGADGKDGESVTVESVTESTEDGGENVTVFSDGKTLAVRNGKRGATGADGQDGVSVTHSWNGTVLTVTSASGTSSADLKGGSDIPDYVLTEAEEVADKILAVRNADTFVMACVSDLHTTGSDLSATGARHVGQALSVIQSLTQLDLVGVLGDIPTGDFEQSADKSFKFVKKCFTDIAKSVPYIQLQGNHDELPSDSTEVARQRYYAFIGANNVGTVTDYANKYRNYGFRDFENYKIRVIYLNTSDVSESEMAYDNNLTSVQMEWFINTALKLSDKDDASEWGVVVCGHHPLNWVASGNGSITKILDVLTAYKGRASGSVTIDGQSLAYDFAGETSEFVCHIHGHLHNFREEVFGANKVLSITVPNACFGRNNEYGNYDYATYPEVVERYGDDGENNDGTGAQRTFNKVSGTAEDTAFSVFCIDRESKTVNVFNYGAGIDRQWDYLNGVKGEGGGEPDVPSYTNQIPLSVNASGGEYVGANGEDGYNTEHRINSSGVESAQAGMCCTGFIQTVAGQTMRLKNVTISGTKSPYLVEYNQDKSYKQVTALDTTLTDDGNGVYTGLAPLTGWIRITCGVIDDTSILTLDEDIA